ncbi:MAG: TetR/AcrR family transcriptional regulator [Cyanobacteria bacterium P01_F01_bin.53]
MSENASKTTLRRWRKPKQARSLARVNRILEVAEEMFIKQGYGATTTKAIAAQAKVPIGSLYQFFPDKAAILQALAEQYYDLLQAKFQAFDTDETAQLPLKDYVDQIVEVVDQFFSEHPGQYAIFMEMQVTLPEVEEAADAELIQSLAKLLVRRDGSLQAEDYEAIAFVTVKAIGNLHWLSLGQPPQFRRRLLEEIKRITFHYFQSYFPG